MIIIKIPATSDKREVLNFLNELQKVLEDSNFDIDSNFILIQSRKSGSKEQFSTPYTLIDLEYDVEDVVERLKELTIGEYCETLFDKNDNHPPLLYVFGKQINSQLVYIKLKIKERKKKYVLCVSFHYAEHNMTFPYKNS